MATMNCFEPRPALSMVLSGLQGKWIDAYGCSYLVPYLPCPALPCLGLLSYSALTGHLVKGQRFEWRGTKRLLPRDAAHGSLYCGAAVTRWARSVLASVPRKGGIWKWNQSQMEMV